MSLYFMLEKNLTISFLQELQKERKLISVLLHHFPMPQKMWWGLEEAFTSRFSKYIRRSRLFVINPNIIKQCQFVLDTNSQYIEKKMLWRLSFQDPWKHSSVQNKLTLFIIFRLITKRLGQKRRLHVYMFSWIFVKHSSLILK